MTIREDERFIPINRIPTLSPEDTVSDAVDAMKAKNTRLAIVISGTENRDLWLDEIAEYCAQHGPVTPWLINIESVIAGAGPSDAFDVTGSPDELGRMLERERAVMITENNNPAGVATGDSQALWPPAVSECIQGHLFFPPIPKRCPYDGTIIG